jgi:hypothetical protein
MKSGPAICTLSAVGLHSCREHLWPNKCLVNITNASEDKKKKKKRMDENDTLNSVGLR